MTLIEIKLTDKKTKEVRQFILHRYKTVDDAKIAIVKGLMK